MTLTPLGFFQELRHGHPDGGSIHESIEPEMPPDERQRVAEYLRGGAILAATSQREMDVIAPNLDAGPVSVRTDGRYYWPEDLAYYVVTYGVAVPDDLRAQAAAGPPRTLTHEELMDCVRSVRGW